MNYFRHKGNPFKAQWSVDVPPVFKFKTLPSTAGSICVFGMDLRPDSDYFTALH
jgi:hypothetical protein